MKKPKTVVELKNVKKTYFMGEGEVEVHALRGIDLTVKENEFVAITGPSGSGKSTLLNLVGCLDIPTSGKVLLNSTDITEFSESELAQIRGRKIGFVFQIYNLIPTLDALHNTTLPLIFQGVPVDEREDRAWKLLKLLGLKKRAYHKPSELSGGEQQRVAIARALAINPSIILADEPTGNLDIKTGKEIIDLLGKLHKKEKKTIIIVTHETFIARYAKRILRLRDGLIIKDDTK